MSRLKYIKFNVQPCPHVWQKLVFPPLPSFQILPTLPFFLIQIKLAYNTTLRKKKKSQIIGMKLQILSFLSKF